MASMKSSAKKITSKLRSLLRQAEKAVKGGAKKRSSKASRRRRKSHKSGARRRRR